MFVCSLLLVIKSTQISQFYKRKSSKNTNKVSSEHLHEYFETTSNLKASHSGSNFLKVSESGVEEMETGEVDVLHFVEINHAFVNILVPGHPCLFFILEFLNHLRAFDRIVLAVHCYEISV